jgi:hypothetical protein
MEELFGVNKVPCWYSDELLLKLNKAGYVHFVAKEQVDVGVYKNGDPFFFKTFNKTYGLEGIAIKEFCDKANSLSMDEAIAVM